LNPFAVDLVALAAQQRRQPPRFADLHPAKLGVPALKRRLADVVFGAHRPDRCVALPPRIISDRPSAATCSIRQVLASMSLSPCNLFCAHGKNITQLDISRRHIFSRGKGV
jgi:hypothetical protein